MRPTILFIFLISLSIHAQENVNEVFINSVELSPSLTLLLNKTYSIRSIPIKINANNIFVDQKSKKQKEHTIHLPMRALTLSEFFQVQGQYEENKNTSNEENNKVMINSYESE